MARITKAQKAGLDFLDLVFFNELVVYRGMDAEERRQLETVILRVTQMAESRHSGRESEIIKHLAYYFLEVSLADTTEELRQVIPVEVAPPDLSKETIEAVDRFTNDFQMAFMLVITQKSMGVVASYALEIADALKGEFVGYSPLVRRDLLKRCFVREFRNVSVGVYCWLTVAGVLPVTKNSPDRIGSEFDEKFITRLTLLADYEMIMHGLKMMISKDNSICVFLGKQEFNLKEATVDRLLDIQKHFNEAITKPSLRGIPLINMRDLASTAQVQDFFERWGSRKVRLRMHTGTLASWLGILGAGMVELQLWRDYDHAAREKYPNGAESVEITELKVPAIFNACDNQHTITEFVKDKLSEDGLKINPDTLYRNHSMMKKTILRLLGIYCKLTRDAGVVMSPIYDDTQYGATFIHSDKLTR
ncbi:hypothetical protein [Pseudomonas syringae]|uniref:hypothetical protein n=1 Tax=Pseudomonas syringae TaxID=317 RepID=UPI000CDA715B|nr:hypothetical protein [Pseudomonas syringae]MCK9697010.1 hypothetical protein [Pseudomonas syringae pv. syringae]MCK9726349.1 hypothetical protein [Pseudomonas syringae pv. syringae]MCK9747079.1 hypothetical protein [Pseudomonas syringae pv. syringae]POR59501.1 hypothetical protein BKM23_13690 [Pseudomonas syringae pv. syringae]